MNNSIIYTGILGTPFLVIGMSTITHTDINNYNSETQYIEVKNEETCLYSEITTLSETNTITSASTLIEDEIDIVFNFAESIITDCKELDGEFSKLIDDNFWDLV